MFGADTPLMMDAFQIAAVVAVGAVGSTLLVQRLRKRSVSPEPPQADASEPSALEERVRVLERIATDSAADLSDEIEALRDEASPELEKTPR
ncbi:MAG: hypothetical protein AAF687_02110 [Pseudomonadota bacterium]